MNVDKIHTWLKLQLDLKSSVPFTNKWGTITDNTFDIWITLTEKEKQYATELLMDASDTRSE